MIRIEMKLLDAERLIDLLFTNTDFPLVRFAPEALEARNINSTKTALYILRALPEWFLSYEVDKEVFAYISADKKTLKATLKSLQAGGADRAVISLKGREIFLGETLIGSVDEKVKEFEVPELKISFKNRLLLLSREFRRWIVNAMKAGAFAVGFACTTPDAIPPVTDPEAVVVRAFGEAIKVDFKPIEVWFDAPKSGSATDTNLIASFLPPSVFERRPFPSTLTVYTVEGYKMPIKLSFQLPPSTIYGPELEFEAYIAPHDEYTNIFLYSVGLLKEPKKETVLEVINYLWETRKRLCSVSEIEDELAKRGYDYDPEKIARLLNELEREDKVYFIERGYTKLYGPAGVDLQLPPLTEEAVLEAIKDLCAALNADAVAYHELAQHLAREYNVDKLMDILRELEKKGLVEFKSQPEKRLYYMVDLRGYWSLKTPPPEEVVKQAEEKPLKTLTKDVVLSAVESLHEVVGENVTFDAIREKLAGEGYDTTNLNSLLDELKREDRVVVRGDGKIWSKTFAERVEEKPPPTPPGYVRVRFLRDIPRYMGMDRKLYGPFKKGDEAVIEEAFARAFEKAGYAEVITARPPERPPEARPPPPPGIPREPPEKPELVKSWEKQLKLNIVGWRSETPPGFRYPVWVLWVVDEGTGETLRVVMGQPYTELHRYKLVRLTNKLGDTVTLLAFAEDAARVETRIPPYPDISKALREAREVVPEDVRRAVEEALRIVAMKPFNWSELKKDVKHFYERIPAWESAAEGRNDVALYSYLTVFKDKMVAWLERLGMLAPDLHKNYAELEARKELPPPKLSKEEIDKLWRVWDETLSKKGIDPNKYREVFNEDVAVAETYNEALAMLRNDIQWVVAQETMKKMTFPVEKPARFSWKDVSRGIAYIKIKLMVLQDDVEEKNAISAYKALRNIVDTTYRLLEILQQSPNIRRFREMTGL